MKSLTLDYIPTDPSGYVLVVGDVVDGVGVCVQDRSIEFCVQSTGDVGVPGVHFDRVSTSTEYVS